jgi:hypothetical protein
MVVKAVAMELVRQFTTGIWYEEIEVEAVVKAKEGGVSGYK